MSSNLITAESSLRSDETPPSSISPSISPPYEDELLLSSSQPLRQKPWYLPWEAGSTRTTVILLFAIVVLLNFGAKLMIIPATRIQENILCHYYYNELEGDGHIGYDQDIPEEMCKGEEVQRRFNVLYAVLGLIGCIPALATTVAYGALADRIGRRPVIALAMIGMILAGFFNITIMICWRVLPLQLIWISPVFILIGGGEAVVNMMFFAIANDVTSEETRSTLFLLGGAGSLFAEITAPSIAAFLMLRSAWIPIVIGKTLLILGTMAIYFLPETLGMKPTLAGEDDVSDISEAPKIDETSTYTILRSKAINMFNDVHESTKMFHSLPILLLLVSFLVGPFGRVAGDMALRYVSNRYHWKLREVGFLLSLQAAVNIVLIVAVLPGLSYYLVSRRFWSSKSKDLFLAQGSAVFLALGALVLAAAPTIDLGIAGLTIWTLGTGFPAITRSLITTLVDQHHVGRLFAIIAVIELLCYMAASPMQAGLYNLGLKWKGIWEGLPYFSLAIMYVVAGMAVLASGWVMRKDMNEGGIRLEDEDVERVDGRAERS